MLGKPAKMALLTPAPVNASIAAEPGDMDSQHSLREDSSKLLLATHATQVAMNVWAVETSNASHARRATTCRLLTSPSHMVNVC